MSTAVFLVNIWNYFAKISTLTLLTVYFVP